MKKRQVFGLMLFFLLVLGCSMQRTPDVICNAPYIRHGTSCCMDQNSNSLCDDDEDSGTLFEPTYADTPSSSPSVKNVQSAVDITPETTEEDDTEYEEPEETTTVITGEKDEVKKVDSKYAAAVPKITGWKDQTDYMSMEVVGMVFDVNKVTPKDLISADQEVWLKEIQVLIKNTGDVVNNDYVYLNPILKVRLMDSFDPRIVSDTLECDASDDLPMIGCESALEVGKTMNITIQVNQKVPRHDLKKTLRLTLENKRDPVSANVLLIEKEFDLLKLSGATYI